ncbi:unnamed protein product [Phytophthora fragariaefolia]|uniref:Unnamed protein product n=1 Tax=Phytophthora fragariaefolia TaxID=1490495 RepID=A0A9W6TIL6_9STRA|nr:unnamed protein product [Phytophthora fragariaefolia]
MEAVSNARRDIDVDKSKAKAMVAEMMKLVGNSAFGRSGMDMSNTKRLIPAIFDEGLHTMTNSGTQSLPHSVLTAGMKIYIDGKLAENPMLLPYVTFALLCEKVQTDQFRGPTPSQASVQNYTKRTRAKHQGSGSASDASRRVGSIGRGGIGQISPVNETILTARSRTAMISDRYVTPKHMRIPAVPTLGNLLPPTYGHNQEPTEEGADRQQPAAESTSGHSSSARGHRHRAKSKRRQQYLYLQGNTCITHV